MKHFSTDWNQAVFIEGEWVKAPAVVEVRDKYDDSKIGDLGCADQQLTDMAVSAAHAAFVRGGLPPDQRYEILMKARDLLCGRAEQVIALMVGETGFTVSDCKTEFQRCQQTFAASAEEAKRIVGEIVPVASAPGQDQRRIAFTVRKPVGVVCAITPFNSPLNTVAHKILPAIAAGNTVVLKPASYTPLCSAVLCDVLAEAGLPPGHLNMVIGPGRSVGQWLLEDQRIRYYTFTGSTEVGRAIQAAAGLRRTQLELGNISATIVCADANMDLAVSKCTSASFRKAGQVCTSVQRIYVEYSVMEEFTRAMVEQVGGLAVGDPRAEGAFVGPMIDAKEARRACEWVSEAAVQGASILTGGHVEGALMQPTVVTGVTHKMRVVNEEAFAPLVTLMPFDSFDQAIDLANDTPFGLSAGIFTSNITRALEAVQKLSMGNIHINDTSSSRVDLMPYGGVKDSGHGQEGPRYAIRDMTEEQLIILNPA